MTESSNPLATLKPPTTDMRLANSSGYVKPFKLCHDLTGEVQEGKAKKGDFWYGKTRNLGPEVLAVPIEQRPHALHLDGSTVVGESFDMDAEEFDRIKKLREKFVSGASFGYDVLCWLPGEGDFGVIFCAKTSLEVAPVLHGLTGHLVRISSYAKPQKKNPKVKYLILQAESAGDETYRFPTADQLAQAQNLFRNPRKRNIGEQGDQDGGEAPAAAKGGRASRKAA